jgi:hypothetical protein
METVLDTAANLATEAGTFAKRNACRNCRCVNERYGCPQIGTIPKKLANHRRAVAWGTGRG